MVRYDSTMVYITSSSTTKEKLNKVNTIIDSLYVLMATSLPNGGVEEYSLNDGQTIISEKYRSINDIERSINGFEKLKNKYLNELNGRVFRLVSEDNLKFRRRR